jgi:hypothetical protein
MLHNQDTLSKLMGAAKIPSSHPCIIARVINDKRILWHGEERYVYEMALFISIDRIVKDGPRHKECSAAPCPWCSEHVVMEQKHKKQ